MGQTKSQDKKLSRHQQERCHDADLGGYVCLSAPGLPEVPIQSHSIDAANTQAAPAQFVHPPRPSDAVAR